MPNRRITVATWSIPNSADIVAVDVSFPESGLGIAPAYRVSAQPMRIERFDGAIIRRYTPSEGYRATIEAAPRFNARKLATLAESADVRAVAVGMYRRILADRGIGGAESAEPADAV